MFQFTYRSARQLKAHAQKLAKDSWSYSLENTLKDWERACDLKAKTLKVNKTQWIILGHNDQNLILLDTTKNAFLAELQLKPKLFFFHLCASSFFWFLCVWERDDDYFYTTASHWRLASTCAGMRQWGRNAFRLLLWGVVDQDFVIVLTRHITPHTQREMQRKLCDWACQVYLKKKNEKQR